MSTQTTPCVRRMCNTVQESRLKPKPKPPPQPPTSLKTSKKWVSSGGGLGGGPDQKLDGGGVDWAK